MENLNFTHPTVDLLESEQPTFSFKERSVSENEFNEELLSVRLTPNGTDKATFTFTVTDQDGLPVPNIPVTFSVEPIYPLGWWRDINQVKEKYNGSSGWKNKKLIGTVNKKVINTDSRGKATVIYTASHIGGSDPNRCGEEEVVARLDNGKIVKATIFLGLTNLRIVNEIAGGLLFKTGVTARYARQDVASILEQIGKDIKKDKWPHPFILTEISYKWGGMIPPHAAHFYGAEIDCRPTSKDGNGTSAGNKECPKAKNVASNYDRTRNKKLAKKLKDSGCTKFYFNDSEIPESTCYINHHNHMHVGWLSQALNDLQNNMIDDFEYEEF